MVPCNMASNLSQERYIFPTIIKRYSCYSKNSLVYVAENKEVLYMQEQGNT